MRHHRLGVYVRLLRKRMRPSESIPLPDHGKAGDPDFTGSVSSTTSIPCDFRNTVLKDFARLTTESSTSSLTSRHEVSPRHGLLLLGLQQLRPEHEPHRTQLLPGHRSRRRPAAAQTGACFNHPDYRAQLRGKVESCLSGYANLVDGFAWGCERMGPLQNAIGGTWATRGLTCFCEFCQAKARQQGISVERARRGCLQLDDFLGAANENRVLPDGYFVTFWRDAA